MSSAADSAPLPARSRLRRLLLGGIPLLLLGGALLVHQFSSQPYILLNIPGGELAWAHDINDQGQVVGTVTTTTSEFLSSDLFLWEQGQLTRLSPTPPIADGSLAHYATINNHGTIIGTLWNYLSSLRSSMESFLWDAKEEGRPFPLFDNLGGPPSGLIAADVVGFSLASYFVRDTNDQHSVVGYCYDAAFHPREKGPPVILQEAPPQHFFIWQKDTGTRNLGETFSDEPAIAINNHNHVAATAPEGVFLWSKEKGRQFLRAQSADKAARVDGVDFPAAINDRDQIVGYTRKSDNTSRAFLWSAATGFQDLGTLGGKSSGAADINQHGHVVGEAETADGIDHAFLWTPEQGMRRLPVPPNAISSSAIAINNRGEIVGFVDFPPPWWMRAWGWLGQQLNLPQKYRGQPQETSRAILWPAPNPSSLPDS